MHVSTLSWEIKNSNFVQVFSRYGRKCEQIAFWVHRWLSLPVSHDISRTILWVCGLSSWLKTKSLTVSTFYSVRALRGLPLHGRLLTVPESRNFFYSLLTPCSVQLFSGNSTVNLFAVYPFKYKLFIKILSSSLNTTLIVDKHCIDVCCDEFSVPQIDPKNKQVKEQWHGNFICNQSGERLAILNTENIKICVWITKRRLRMQFVCVFFHICRKFEFLISQSSVATCRKWDG